MARLYRLFAPGAAFAAVGLAVLVLGQLPWFHLRGGLVTTGVYAFALQLVLSAFLVSAIDDLSGGGPPLSGRRAGRGTGQLVTIGTRPIGFLRALVEFYRRPFWPVLLLAFGVGASLSAFLAGALHRIDPIPVVVLEDIWIWTQGSEAVLGVVLVLVAALLWWRGGRSYFGWVIGVTVAAAVGQAVFVPDTLVDKTVLGWGGLAIGLCLVRGLAFGAARVRRGGVRSLWPREGVDAPRHG